MMYLQIIAVCHGLKTAIIHIVMAETVIITITIIITTFIRIITLFFFVAPYLEISICEIG